MAIPRWQPGRVYQTGAVVQDVTSGTLQDLPVTNGDFELGDQDWVLGSNWVIENVAGLGGSWRARNSGGSLAKLRSTPTPVDSVTPGITRITVSAFFQTDGTAKGRVGIEWLDNIFAPIHEDYLIDEFGFEDEFIDGDLGGYKRQEMTAVAPEGAQRARVIIQGLGGTGDVLVDNVTWDYAFLNPVSELIFRNIQTPAGFSGTSEPVWPVGLGGTVVDNECTWQAVQANRVVWTCGNILVSGAVEPTFPTTTSEWVLDGTIAWETFTRRILDENCPNTKQVAIAASKVFAGDDDIVAFSATVNPLDWTTELDAGYIPFGLNTYGSQPVSALGIYRSNLVVFNSKAFQMWQVDEDPANFAILDAVAVGCPFSRSVSPVSNDLVFLTKEGIRSMGIAGASTNLQAGFFGKQIDPLVAAALAGISDEDDIISLFFPGAGQYWLIFGAEAFVLTINGGRQDMAWSRYVFPSAITDWTIKDTDLYLRSGDKVWRFDADTLVDDAGGTDVEFVGKIWWPHLDFGAIGVTKTMEGFDVVADGSFSISVAYDQNDLNNFTPPYDVPGDTLTGQVTPLQVTAPSLQIRLEFDGNQAWEWSATVIYLNDFRRAS